MAGFMDLHKMVGKSAFLAILSEWKGETKSEELKPQFSQVEGDLNLQKMFKPIPIPHKNTKNKIK